MIRYRHKGCTAEVMRYVGDTPLSPGMLMRSAEWRYPDGSQPPPSAPIPNCPDCGERVKLWRPTNIEPIPETEPAET